MLNKKEQELLDLIDAQSKAHGIEIVTLEITGAKRSPLIRIYIDSPNGISFTELSDAQSWIGDIVEREDPFPGAYTLEVSSPGIDRPLRTPEHFQRFVGEDVRIKTLTPVEGSSNFKGILIRADEQNASIENQNGVFDIPYSVISKANVIGKIDF